MTKTEVIVQALTPEKIGTTKVVAGRTVRFELWKCDISFQKWTADYKALNTRPWRVKNRRVGFASLEAAVASFDAV